MTFKSDLKKYNYIINRGLVSTTVIIKYEASFLDCWSHCNTTILNIISVHVDCNVHLTSWCWRINLTCRTELLVEAVLQLVLYIYKKLKNFI